MMDQFSECSGLSANQVKSELYYEGIEEVEKTCIINSIGIQDRKLPFRYLRVP